MKCRKAFDHIVHFDLVGALTAALLTATYMYAQRAGEHMASESERTLGAVEYAFELAELLAEEGPIGVSAIAERTDTPKSTVHIHLRTLRDLGYATRIDDRYDVGLRFLETGSIARRRRDIYRAGRREVDKLAIDVDEAAHLGVEEDGSRVILYKSETGEAVYDDTPTGEFTSMHWTSIGKALLAHLPSTRVDEIITEHGLDEATDSTITDSDELREELELIRERGYAVENEERREGVVAVAVPVFDTETEHVVAAMSISGPRERIIVDGDDSIREDLLDALRHHANITELRYNHY